MLYSAIEKINLTWPERS